MEHFDRERERLTHRWVALDERIRVIESVANERGYACVDEDVGDLSANPILDRCLMPLRKEKSKAASAIRRIDRREFDCCIHCGGKIDRDRLEQMPYAAICSACGAGTSRTLAEALELQHDEIREMMLQLLEVVAMLRARLLEGDGGGIERSASVALIVAFERELNEHLLHEEKGGYLGEVLSGAPHLASRANVLAGQHRGLSKRLHKLRSAMQQAGDLGSEWETIQIHLQEFAHDLFAHETNENEIVMEALMDDLGGAG